MDILRSKLPAAFTRVTPGSKFIAMLLFVLLPFVGFYLGMQYGRKSSFPILYLSHGKQGLTLIKTPEPFTLTTEDLTAMKEACIGDNKAPITTYTFSIQAIEDTFIKAAINAQSGGGGYAFLTKETGKWVCPIQGNGIPDCKTVDSYNFPSSLIPSCMRDNQLITR